MNENFYYYDEKGKRKVKPLSTMSTEELDSYQKYLDGHWLIYLILSILTGNLISIVLFIVAKVKSDDSYTYCNLFKVGKIIFWVEILFAIISLCCFFCIYAGILGSIIGTEVFG